MSDEKATKESLVTVLPSLLWVLLAAVALIMFYQPLSDLLARSTKIKLGNIEVEAKSLLEKSAKRLPPKFATGSSDTQILRLKTQWLSLPEKARPYRILVAHDVFVEAKPIQRAFVDLGFEADIALCPDDIEKALKQHIYDAVVSDIKWDECKNQPTTKQNGVNFLNYAVEQKFDQPTVFFINEFHPEKGVPKHSYGISNNWYDVLEYVFAVIKQNAEGVKH